jgi:eukaryotic translation initiation factor 2C
MLKNNKVYKLLKFLAETEIGIVTQCCCLTPYNARSPAFLTSLAHKINVKMGGRNADEGLLPFFDYEEHVMLMRADVN